MEQRGFYQELAKVSVTAKIESRGIVSTAKSVAGILTIYLTSKFYDRVPECCERVGWPTASAEDPLPTIWPFVSGSLAKLLADALESQP